MDRAMEMRVIFAFLEDMLHWSSSNSSKESYSANVRTSDASCNSAPRSMAVMYGPRLVSMKDSGGLLRRMMRVAYASIAVSVAAELAVPGAVAYDVDIDDDDGAPRIAMLEVDAARGLVLAGACGLS